MCYKVGRWLRHIFPVSVWIIQMNTHILSINSKNEYFRNFLKCIKTVWFYSTVNTWYVYLLYNRMIIHGKKKHLTKIISLLYVYFCTSCYLRKWCSFYINYANFKGLTFFIKSFINGKWNLWNSCMPRTVLKIFS